MPDNMLDSSPAPYVLQYEVVLAGFEARALTELETNLGDVEFWVTLGKYLPAGRLVDASQIYRDWVLNNAVWTRAGNLSTRARDPGYPHWLLRTPLWTQGDAPVNSSTGLT